MVRRGTARLGYLARRALFRIPDTGHGRQEVLLRLARCAGRLHGEVQEPVQEKETGFRRILEEESGNRAASLYRQGYPLFPRALLAGHARILGLPYALKTCGERLSYRERREDVQKPRHLHHRRELSPARAQPRVAALLLRREIERDDGGY